MPWGDVLEGFLRIRGPSALHEAPDAPDLQTIEQSLLADYGKAREEWMKGQETTADDFNLVEVLQATHDELRHSAMLAWLLDHRMDHYGTHAQASLGFQLFLKKLGLPVAYAEKNNYWVRREVAGEMSRVDVEVAARDYFIIHIENKLQAEEGEEQTSREWEDLLRRAKDLAIPQKAVHALFLTPDRKPPQNPKFKAISWSSIACVLEEFSIRAKAGDVRLFAAHYARALREVINAEYHRQENQNEKETI